MHTEFSQDQAAQHIAVASIRRHSIAPNEWLNTVIGRLHPDLALIFNPLPDELPIASSFFSQASWWVISTQRIVSQYEGALCQLDPRYGLTHQFGNFKGDTFANTLQTETAIVQCLKTNETVRLEFEAGKASMAVIYACIFWSRTTAFHHGGREAARHLQS